MKHELDFSNTARVLYGESGHRISAGRDFVMTGDMLVARIGGARPPAQLHAVAVFAPSRDIRDEIEAEGAARREHSRHGLERGGQVIVSEQRLAGTVAVNVPDALLVSRTLKARGFIVDYRPPVGIRVSPHFYNTIEEIERLMAEMAGIVAKKDYADGSNESVVT